MHDPGDTSFASQDWREGRERGRRRNGRGGRGGRGRINLAGHELIELRPAIRLLGE